MMMKSFKKVLFGGVALSAFSFVTVSPVFAAEGSEDGKGATSYGHVVLEGNDDEGTGSIVDPEPDGDGNTGNTGSLTIDYASNLEFEGKLSSKATTYLNTTSEPHVQVTDVRGTGGGWTLQVTASKFEDTDTGKTLKGASITLPSGQLQTTEDNIAAVEEPTTSGVTVEADGEGSLSTVMMASYDKGMGTWADKFEANGEKITLNVPAGNYAGDYTAELTWTLSDAPQ